MIVPSDRKSTAVVIRRLLECAICLWWSIASVAASTPPLSVKRFSTDDGLPAHTVNAIVQTPDGYLWLATAGGLVRFDGLHFTAFNTQSGLPANRIDALAVSPDGALWLSPEEGYVMRRDPQRFTQMARGKSCLQLTFDRSGKLWCGYGRALQRLDKDSWLDATVTLTEESQMMVDGGGVAWALLADLHPAWLEDGRIQAHAFQGDPTTRLVRSLSDGAVAFSRVAAGRTEVVDVEGRTRFSIPRAEGTRPWLIDRNGALWTTTGETLELWLPAREPPLLQLALPEAGRVLTAFEDSERNVWLGSATGGLYRVQASAIRWFGAADGLPLERVWFVRQLSHGPVSVSQGKAVAYRLEDDRFVVDPDTQIEPRTIGYDVGPDGTEWRGTVSGEVLVQRAGAIQRFVLSPPGNAQAVGIAASRAHPGVAWAITTDALYRVEPTAPLGQDVQRVLDGLEVTHFVVEDKQGDVWISTQSGLHRWSNGAQTMFGVKEGVPADPLLQIHADSSGAVWIGSYGGGLIRHKQGRFVVLGERDGLHEDVVSAVLEDDAGNLWLSGNRGIQRVSLAELNARAEGAIARVNAIAYGRDAGLINPEGSGYPGLKSSDGRLWFPMLTGLAVIDPKLATSLDSSAPPVEIERLECTPERRLEVEYAGLSLRAGEQLRYRYQLEGFDTEWIDAGSSRRAMYTNLPPGDYTFRVQAAVGGSAFSREAAARPFSIKPLFRETRLFYVLCGLTVLAVALTGLRWRTSALRARAAELEQAMQERGAPPVVSHERASAIFVNVPVAKQTAEKAPGFAELTQKLPLERGTGAASVVSDESLLPAAVETVAPQPPAESSESLPAEAAPVVEPVAEPAVEPVVTFDVRTVLIVDDNANLRAFFRSHLEPRFDVLEASDGEDALRVAHDRRLEMILTDSAMPMMDGFALCRALRHDPDLRHIPVILFADAPGPDTAEAAASGAVDVAADAYLPKPFQPSELLDCIDEVIKSRNRPATRSQTN